MKPILVVLATIAAAFELLNAQTPDAAQIAQERRQAELEVPKLVDALALQPSMTVADVGAGGGAMTVVLAKWLRTGRVIATDIDPKTLDEIREYAKREGLTNVTVIEGARASTGLPDRCCDAILMRNVYHHLNLGGARVAVRAAHECQVPGAMCQGGCKGATCPMHPGAVAT